MKTRKSHILSIAFLVALAILLSACQVNFITEIKNNGSGTFTQEIGFQGDEATMAGLGDDGEEFCSQQEVEAFPGTSIRRETRNGDETWCIYETPFGSLEELELYYGTTDTWINDISISDGVLTYDITVDLSGDSSAPMGADLYWVVVMPGSITENNAGEQDGNTLRWQVYSGTENHIRAVSEVGGLGGDWLWYILGGVAVVSLCCILPLIIAGVVFFLIRRKKAKTATDTTAPVEE